MEKNKVIVLPKALDVMVAKSIVFSAENFWNVSLLSQQEALTVKELIEEYYSTIPPENFAEMANHYYEHLQQQILKQESKGDFRVFMTLLDTKELVRNYLLLQG